MSFLLSAAAAAVFASLLPSASAHMAIWHPSVYGFAQPYEPVTPLSGLPFDKWWFHGNAADAPAESMTITAGQPLTVQISCNKVHSIYGNETSTDACPKDSGSYHAGGSGATGWESNSEANLKGCALAISPTANAAITKPEDFTVMSVLAKCVRQRDTVFPIPANLPACPAGGCTCAWFWLNTRNEMYMTGFKCDVAGGSKEPFPKPVAPKRGAIKGATQPIYWANDMPNIGYTPDDTTRPTYTSDFGWVDGAQSEAFGAGGANPVPGPASQAAPVASSAAGAPTSAAQAPPASSSAAAAPSSAVPAPPAAPSSAATAPSSASKPAPAPSEAAGPSTVASSAPPKPTKTCHRKPNRSRVRQSQGGYTM